MYKLPRMYDDLDQLDGCLHSDSFLQPADQKSDLHWVWPRDVGEEVILPPPGMLGILVLQICCEHLWTVWQIATRWVEWWFCKYTKIGSGHCYHGHLLPCPPSWTSWPKPWLLQPMSTTILPPLSQTSGHQNSSQLLTFAFIYIGYLMIMPTFDRHTRRRKRLVSMH